MMTITAVARIVTSNCPIYAAALNIERMLIRSLSLLLPPILDVDEELSWPAEKVGDNESEMRFIFM